MNGTANVSWKKPLFGSMFGSLCLIIWFESNFMNFPMFSVEIFYSIFVFFFAVISWTVPRFSTCIQNLNTSRNGISLESDWDFFSILLLLLLTIEPGTIYIKIYRDEIAFDIYWRFSVFLLSSLSFFVDYFSFLTQHTSSFVLTRPVRQRQSVLFVRSLVVLFLLFSL